MQCGSMITGGQEANPKPIPEQTRSQNQPRSRTTRSQNQRCFRTDPVPEPTLFQNHSVPEPLGLNTDPVPEPPGPRTEPVPEPSLFQNHRVPEPSHRTPTSRHHHATSSSWHTSVFHPDAHSSSDNGRRGHRQRTHTHAHTPVNVMNRFQSCGWRCWSHRGPRLRGKTQVCPHMHSKQTHTHTLLPGEATSCWLDSITHSH